MEPNADFWLGKLIIEIAVACTVLETSGDMDLACTGLKDTMEEFLEEWEEDILAEAVREYRRDALAVTTVPVSVDYRGTKSVTAEEIMDMI